MLSCGQPSARRDAMGDSPDEVVLDDVGPGLLPGWSFPGSGFPGLGASNGLSCLAFSLRCMPLAWAWSCSNIFGLDRVSGDSNERQGKKNVSFPKESEQACSRGQRKETESWREVTNAKKVVDVGTRLHFHRISHDKYSIRLIFPIWGLIHLNATPLLGHVPGCHENYRYHVVSGPSWSCENRECGFFDDAVKP